MASRHTVERGCGHRVYVMRHDEPVILGGKLEYVRIGPRLQVEFAQAYKFDRRLTPQDAANDGILLVRCRRENVGGSSRLP